jgi:hypothetical protein
MVWILLAILFLGLWLLGVLTTFTLGGFLHVLLLLAFTCLVLRLLRGSAHDLRGRTWHG